MRVDFYHAGRDPVEAIVALIARNTLKAGKRLLVVAGEAPRLDGIGQALWDRAGVFLAHGRAGGDHDARQPVLLSDRMEPANGASFVALADGLWREPEGFERAFLIFDEATRGPAREVWRTLSRREGAEIHYWKQEDGRWIEAG